MMRALCATCVQLLCPSSHLITFTCCSSCKSTPPVTCTTPVTHLDGLSGELRGIIQLSAWESQQNGRRAACDPKQTSCRHSALYFFILCCRFFFSVCGAQIRLCWAYTHVSVGGCQYIFIYNLFEHSAMHCFILTEKAILQKPSSLKYVNA